MKSKDLDKVDKGIAMNNNKQPKRKWEIADNDGIIHIFDNQKDYILFIKKETAQQIFSELDKIAWQQIEPEKLEKFSEEFSKANTLASAYAIFRKFCTMRFSVEDYDAIKKKYGVD